MTSAVERAACGRISDGKEKRAKGVQISREGKLCLPAALLSRACRFQTSLGKSIAGGLFACVPISRRVSNDHKLPGMPAAVPPPPATQLPARTAIGTCEK